MRVSGVWRLSYGIEEVVLAWYGCGRGARGGNCLLFAVVLCLCHFAPLPGQIDSPGEGELIAE